MLAHDDFLFLFVNISGAGYDMGPAMPMPMVSQARDILSLFVNILFGLSSDTILFYGPN